MHEYLFFVYRFNIIDTDCVYKSIFTPQCDGSVELCGCCRCKNIKLQYHALNKLTIELYYVHLKDLRRSLCPLIKSTYHKIII